MIPEIPGDIRDVGQGKGTAVGGDKRLETPFVRGIIVFNHRPSGSSTPSALNSNRRIAVKLGSVTSGSTFYVAFTKLTVDIGHQLQDYLPHIPGTERQKRYSSYSRKGRKTADSHNSV